MKVLVIEDSTSQRNLIMKILARLEGIEAIPAPDALEGYLILNQDPDIKAMVLDHHMPFVKGGDFIKKVRSKGQFYNLPIIISSGEDDTERFMEAGATEVLIKPYELNSLSAAIERARSFAG